MAEIDRWCCWASTSVGASSTACPPESTTRSIARSATSVLPEPDLALQQPVHRVRLGELGLEHGADLALAGGELEGQPLVEGREQSPATGARLRSEGTLRGTPTGQHQLEHERLLEPEAALRGAGLGVVVGAVHQPEGGHHVEHVVALAQLGRQHVGHVGDQVERHPDHLDQVPDVELVGERVDRQQLAEGLVLPVAVAEHQLVRLLELPAAVEDLGLAGEESAAAGGHLFDVRIGLPGIGTEERQREGRTVGADADLGAELRLAPALERLHRSAGHLADDRQQLADLGGADLGELGGLDVAAGEVPQQLPDRGDAEALLDELALG